MDTDIDRMASSRDKKKGRFTEKPSKRVQQEKAWTDGISYNNNCETSVEYSPPSSEVDFEKRATNNKQSRLWVASSDQQQEAWADCNTAIDCDSSSVEYSPPPSKIEFKNRATNNKQSRLWVASSDQQQEAWADCNTAIDCDSSSVEYAEDRQVEYACEAASVTKINSYTMNFTQKVVYCEPCHIGQTVIQAHGFCTNCAEHLCKSCCRSHKNHKAFKDHVLQNKDEMPTDDEKTTIEDHCLKHEDKPIEYYCTSCDELACTVCMFKQHRSCQNVDYIPELAETLEDTDEYKELTKDMNNLATKCTTGRKSLEASLRNSEESKDKAISKIKNEKDEIKKVFDRLETKMKDKVQARYRIEQGKLIDLKEKQEALTGQLEMAKKRIEYSRKARQMIKLFISVKKERKTVDNLENELQKLKQGNIIQSYTFKVSPSVEDIKVLLEFGELNIEESQQETVKKKEDRF